jgi:hypothetical protein
MSMREIDSRSTATFEDPRAILLACHEKLRYFSRLTARLGAHVASNGADTAASHTAKGILRYFDFAAPLHHDDEELDLFPALRALCNPMLNVAINELEAEHEDLAELWESVRLWLDAIAHGETAEPPAILGMFCRRYVIHAGAEETEIYAAMVDLPAEVMAAIGRSMCVRRGLK